MESRAIPLSRSRPSLGVPGLLALALLLPVAASAQEDLTPLDVLMLRSVSGAYPSPDGTTIVFTRSVPRGPEDGVGGGYSALYALTEVGERPLVTGKRGIGGVAWRPDGRSVTFLENREGDSGRQLYALPLDGGEAQRVFTTKYGISQYRWRADGGAVAFTATLPAPEVRVGARAAGFRQRVYDEDWNPIGLFVWTAESGEVRELEVPGSVYDLQWSPDGTRIAASIAPRALTDDSYMFKRIHVIDAASGAVQKLVDNPGKLGPIGWSPDSRSIAYISAADVRDPHSGMLFLADVNTGAVTELTPGYSITVAGSAVRSRIHGWPTSA